MLAFVVQDKFLTLCSTYQRATENELVPPVILDGDMLRWRQMLARHKKGDRRHTESEIRSVQAIADWILKVNAKLTNQEEVPKIVWR